MSRYLSLDALWQTVPLSDQVFRPDQFTELPDRVQRYLNHAIAPGTPLASAVRLKMHGEIKLKQWQPFKAEQVICWNQGMIWRAKSWMNGLPMSGWDRLVNGVGMMQWKLLGLIPVMTAAGDDITRSAIGRMQGECIWLPSVFCDRSVQWTTLDDCHISAKLPLLGETTELVFTVNETGQLEQLNFLRWGNPEGAAYHAVSFGGYLKDENTFWGYTIPTQLRVGWYFGSNSPAGAIRDRFESDGEFFRAIIDEAIYR